MIPTYVIKETTKTKTLLTDMYITAATDGLITNLYIHAETTGVLIDKNICYNRHE